MDVIERRLGNQIFGGRLQTQPLQKRDVKSASLRDYGASVNSLEKPLFFEFGKIFANSNFADPQAYRQVFDLRLALLLQKIDDSRVARLRRHHGISCAIQVV